MIFRRPSFVLAALITARRCVHRGNVLQLLKVATMAVPGAVQRIQTELLSWPHVEAHPHRFGGTEYRIGRRELGHIHGDHLVDIPFPTKVRDEVVTAGQAEPHHLLPDSGWVSLYLRKAADVDRALALFRRSFELTVKQKGLSLEP
jgi:hypothetical protein